MSEELLKPAIVELILNDNVTRTERILRKTLIELISAGRAEFLMLRDNEVREYWANVWSWANRTFDDRCQKSRLYDIKAGAYDKLTDEDRKILRIRKPVKPRYYVEAN